MNQLPGAPSRQAALPLSLPVHTAAVRRWPTGAVDIDIWPDNAYRVLHLEASAVDDAQALTRTAEKLAEHGWRVTGPWAHDGAVWRAVVGRT